MDTPDFANIPPERIMAEVKEHETRVQLSAMLRDIGALLQQYRKNRNLSQERLADLTGVQRPDISYWENGLYLSRLLRHVPELAKHLGAQEIGGLVGMFLKAQRVHDMEEDAWLLQIDAAVTAHVADQFAANPLAAPSEPPIDEISARMGRTWPPFNLSLREDWRVAIRKSFKRFE
jgi:transcriptional regulator with XRE-family HTH domain